MSETLHILTHYVVKGIMTSAASMLRIHDIIGFKLDQDTPYIVWKQLATRVGLKLHRSLDAKDVRTPDLQDIAALQREMCDIEIAWGTAPQATSWRMMAQLINPEEKSWTPRNIIAAMDNILKCKLADVPAELGCSTITDPTNAEPKSINLWIAVRLALEIGVPLTYRSDLSDIVFGLKIWRLPETTANMYFQCLNNMAIPRFKTNMLEGGPLRHMRVVAQATRPSRDDLCTAHDQMSLVNYVGHPSSLSQWVCHMARFHNTNIMRTRDPMLTATRIKTGEMKSRNELLYFIDTDLPPLVGTPEAIRCMALSFGLPIAAPGSSLTTKSPSQMAMEITEHIMSARTFYPYSSMSYDDTKKFDTTTIMASEIKDIPVDKLVVYGKFLDPIAIVTYEELAMAFDNQSGYHNCLDRYDGKRSFDDKAIHRLRFLADSVSCAKILQRSMCRIDTILDSNSNSWKDLVSIYNDSSKIDKIRAESMLDLLMDMGMYMRSWSGQGEYPIKTAPGDLDEKRRDKRVIEAIGRYEDALIEATKSMPATENKGESKSTQTNICAYIDSLPITVYRDNKFTYPKVGAKTIRERIIVVKSGDTSSTADSCIRMSSNWIVTAAFRAQLLLGIQTKFTLQDLEHIA